MDHLPRVGGPSAFAFFDRSDKFPMGKLVFTCMVYRLVLECGPSTECAERGKFPIMASSVCKSINTRGSCVEALLAIPSIY
jgi:hypothetical protein